MNSMNMPPQSEGCAIYIFGNKQGNSGFAAQLVVGKSRSLPDSSYPGFENAGVFYVIRNEADHTLYTAVFSNVSSYGAARGGSLKIAIAVPCHMAFADGVSPYDVLNEVCNYYVQNYMTHDIGGYHFTPKPEDPQEFRAISLSHPLVAVAVPHRPMTGQQPACVVADETVARQLFADTQYPEFVPYSEIIVASANASVWPTLQVEVPRRPRYKVIVNNTNFGLLDPLDSLQQSGFRVYVPAPSSFQKPIDFTFTFDQALAGQIPGLSVDAYEETITGNFGFSDIEVPRQIHITVSGNGWAGNVDYKDFRLIAKDAKGRQRVKSLDGEGRCTLVGAENDLLWTVETVNPDFHMVGGTTVPSNDGVYYVQAEYRPQTAAVKQQKSKSQASDYTPQNAAERLAPTAKSSVDRKSKLQELVLIGVGIAVVAFLLGLGLGYWLFSPSEDKETKAPTEQAANDESSSDKIADPGSSVVTEEVSQEERLYNDYVAKVKDINLTRAEAQGILNWLKQGEPKAIDDLQAKKLSELAANYIFCIDKANNFDLKTLRAQVVQSSLLTEAQRNILQDFCGNYDANKKLYEDAKKKGNLESFADLKALVDKCKNESPKGKPKPSPKNDGLSEPVL